MPQCRLVETTITIELTPQDASILAIYLKRLCWSDYRSCSVNEDQAYEMKDGLGRLREQINTAGFDPR